MDKCIICNNELPTVYSSINNVPVCCSDCHDECARIHLSQTRKRRMNYIAFVIMLIIIAFIMICNDSFAQSDEEFCVANTQYDSIGSLYCCNGHPWPCTEPFEPKLTIIGWDLRVHKWLIIDTYTERAWAFKLYWVPKYKEN